MKRKTKIAIAASLAMGGLLFYLLRKPKYTFVDTGVWCDDSDCSNIDEMTAENYIEYCEDELGYNRTVSPNPDLVSCSLGQRPTRSGEGHSGWTNILLDGPYADDFKDGDEIYIEQDEESQVYPQYNGWHTIMKIKGKYVIQIDVNRQGDSMPVGGTIYKKSIVSGLLGV